MKNLILLSSAFVFILGIKSYSDHSTIKNRDPSSVGAFYYNPNFKKYHVTREEPLEHLLTLENESSIFRSWDTFRLVRNTSDYYPETKSRADLVKTYKTKKGFIKLGAPTEYSQSFESKNCNFESVDKGCFLLAKSYGGVKAVEVTGFFDTGYLLYKDYTCTHRSGYYTQEGDGPFPYEEDSTPCSGFDSTEIHLRIERVDDLSDESLLEIGLRPYTQEEVELVKDAHSSGGFGLIDATDRLYQIKF